jgi:hypothetical protein
VKAVEKYVPLLQLRSSNFNVDKLSAAGSMADNGMTVMERDGDNVS